MLALLQAVCAGRGSDDAADVSAGSRRQWERAAAGIICGGKAAAVDALTLVLQLRREIGASR